MRRPCAAGVGRRAVRWTTRVRDRIVAETRGNPLALLELPRGMTPAELAGRLRPADARGVPGRIEESFGRRVQAAACRHAAAPAARCGGAGRRPGPGVGRRRAARDPGRSRGTRGRGEPARAQPSACASGTRSCVRPSTARPRPENAGSCIARWPRSPTATLTPIAARGIERVPQPDPTRRSPRSSSARPSRAHARGGVAAEAAFLARVRRADPRPGTPCRAPARRGGRQATSRRVRAGADPVGARGDRTA